MCTNISVCASWSTYWTSLVAQIVSNLPAMQETQSQSLVGKIPWRRDRLSTPVFLHFPDGSDGKESACNMRDLGSIPGLGRSLGGGHGNPLQYSCLENPHGQRSPVGYSPWGHEDSDTTKRLSTAHSTWLTRQKLNDHSNLSFLYLIFCETSIFKVFCL